MDTQPKLRKDGLSPEVRGFVTNSLCLQPIEKLVDTDFYMVCFNVSCKTENHTYIPIELGIARFNLREGFKDVHHEFIDGGRIPIGYSFEVKDHAERVHKIPLEDYSTYPVPEQVAASTKAVHIRQVSKSLDNFDEFVKPEKIWLDEKNKAESRFVKPVFSFADTEELGCTQTVGCLKQMSKEAERPEFFRGIAVLDAKELLYHLYRRLSSLTRPMAICHDDFVRATMNFEEKVNCDFHETTETIHCARAKACRFAYKFIDVLLPLTTIEPTDAHRPTRTRIEPIMCDFFSVDNRVRKLYGEAEKRNRSRWYDQRF